MTVKEMRPAAATRRAFFCVHPRSAPGPGEGIWSSRRRENPLNRQPDALDTFHHVRYDTVSYVRSYLEKGMGALEVKTILALMLGIFALRGLMCALMNEFRGARSWGGFCRRLLSMSDLTFGGLLFLAIVLVMTLLSFIGIDPPR